MARLGRLESDLGRFEVTHFADEDDLWRLAKSGPKRGCKILGVRTDLALVYRDFLWLCRNSIGSSIVTM